MLIRRLLCCWAVSFALPATAQLPPREVSRAIDSAAALIQRHYVFAAKGESIAKHLREQYKAGAFNNIPNWKAFDSAGTAILRSYSQDGHLYLRYSPEKVKNLRSEQQPHGVDDFFHSRQAREHNYGFREVKVLEGNTGYIKLDEINISDESLPVLQAAMALVSRTRALIIDLRNNGGGGSEIKPVLESYFLPGNKALLTFHSRTGNTETDSTITIDPACVYKGDLHILINKRTASAAEAFAYVMQAQHRAKITGQPSAGGANHNALFVVNDDVFISISEAAPVLPGTQKNWEGAGVQPDYVTNPGKEMEEVLRRISQ